MGRKLYQGIKADGAADDSPSQAKGESNETLFLEGGSGHSGRKVIGKRRDLRAGIYVQVR